MTTEPSAFPPLHQAIVAADPLQVDRLLAAGANVNEPDAQSGQAPLHLAAQVGSPALVEQLLAHGAFINQQTPTRGLTALMLAIRHRNAAIAALLLAQPALDPDIRAHCGRTAEQMIVTPAALDDLFARDQQKHLLQRFQARRLWWQRQMETQAVFLALTRPDTDARQKTDTVRALILAGAQVDTVSPVAGDGNGGQTPLRIAARDGLAEVVQLLLQAGADQALADAGSGEVALHLAASRGHAAVIDVLAHYPGFDPIINLQTQGDGYTPLHHAARHGQLAAARLLLAHGARSDRHGHDGRTPGDLARDFHYPALTQLLALGVGE